ncbi:MAG: hypothetical protein AAF560_27470 [Acidobacteriota bacterium]
MKNQPEPPFLIEAETAIIGEYLEREVPTAPGEVAAPVRWDREAMAGESAGRRRVDRT